MFFIHFVFYDVSGFLDGRLDERSILKTSFSAVKNVDEHFSHFLDIFQTNS